MFLGELVRGLIDILVRNGGEISIGDLDDEVLAGVAQDQAGVCLLTFCVGQLACVEGGFFGKAEVIETEQEDSNHCNQLLHGCSPHLQA
jgi:hypothetical protein